MNPLRLNLNHFLPNPAAPFQLKARTTLVGVWLAASLIAPRAQAESLGFTYLQRAAAPELEVTVADDLTGIPLPQAQVWINEGWGTEAPSTLLPSRILPADGANGGEPLQVRFEFDFNPTSAFAGSESMTDSQYSPFGVRIITVQMEGYQRFSLAGIQAGKLEVYLKPLASSLPQRAQLVGELGNWELPSSGFMGAKTIAAGIVFPVLSANDLMRFDPSLIISPERDTIDIMGPRQIPSNFVLPAQDVAVSIVPIHLEKPNYRLPMRPQTTTRLTAVEGEIAVSDVTSGLGGGSNKLSLTILNKVNLKKLGVTPSLTTPAPGQELRTDIRVPTKLVAKHRVKVSNVPFPADVLVTAVSDFDNRLESMIPTDLKIALSRESGATSGTQTLVAPERPIGKAEHLIAIALSEGYRNLSCIVAPRVTGSIAAQVMRPEEMAMQEVRGGVTEFSNFMNPVPISDSPELPESVELAAPPQGIAFLALEGQTPEWIIMALPQAGRIPVPVRKLGVDHQASFRGITQFQLDFGVGFDQGSIDRHAQLGQVKRLTRSHAKFGN